MMLSNCSGLDCLGLGFSINRVLAKSKHKTVKSHVYRRLEWAWLWDKYGYITKYTSSYIPWCLWWKHAYLLIWCCVVWNISVFNGFKKSIKYRSHGDVLKTDSIWTKFQIIDGWWCFFGCRLSYIGFVTFFPFHPRFQ